MAPMATARQPYGARSRRFETDLSDQEWALVEAMLPGEASRGRRRSVCLRSVVDAVFYVLHTGAQWRFLPSDFPPWSTVYGYFRRWMGGGVVEEIHGFLRTVVRLRDGRDPEPSAGIIDSQTVKASAQAIDPVGYDAGKKTKGRKRHIVVDTLGMLLGLKVHPASVQDRDGAALVFGEMAGRHPRLTAIFADAGYQGPRAAAAAPAELVIVKRTQPGFVVLPKRWIVERTFAWLVQNRRLARDYEGLAATSEAFVRLAMIRLMLRRIFA